CGYKPRLEFGCKIRGGPKSLAIFIVFPELDQALAMRHELIGLAHRQRGFQIGFENVGGRREKNCEPLVAKLDLGIQRPGNFQLPKRVDACRDNGCETDEKNKTEHGDRRGDGKMSLHVNSRCGANDVGGINERLIFAEGLHCFQAQPWLRSIAHIRHKLSSCVVQLPFEKFAKTLDRRVFWSRRRSFNGLYRFSCERIDRVGDSNLEKHGFVIPLEMDVEMINRVAAA